MSGAGMAQKGFGKMILKVIFKISKMFKNAPGELAELAEDSRPTDKEGNDAEDCHA